MCQKCGTVSPTEVKTCPSCGASLVFAPDKTGRSARLAAPPGPAKPKVGETSSTRTPKPPAGPTPPPPSAPRRSAPQPRPGANSSSPQVRRDALVGQTLSDYVIEEKIGVGGMGVVYRAVQPMIGKQVAIKVLRQDVVTDPRDVERLLEEARIVNQIKHRGIINIFGAGSLEDGRHYLIMELLEGESLEQKMQREGRIALPDAVAILDEVLSALAAAHQAGIVHRDLKPANVFLVNEGGKVFVKLLDFGLARKQAADFSRIAGTPDYISPEHARGRPAGPPADLYGFGILCFHMLTGQLPFTGTTPMEVMEKHVHSAPPVAHELNPQIPKALSELIMKLLAKEPGTRPDAQQVKADLRAATKQFRNMPTMMSLAQVDAVADQPAKKEEGKRAVELAVKAQVADIKRQVTRRWPYVIAAVVGVWFLAVIAYVMWPTPDPTAKPAKPKDPVARVENPKGAEHPDTPKNPETPDTQPQNPAVTPEAARDAGGEAVAVAVATGGGAGEAATEAPDAAVEEKMDYDAVLDDFALGERKRNARFDERLSSMAEIMKSPGEGPKKKLRYGNEYESVKKKCDEAKTLRQIFDASDSLKDLEDAFFNTR